MAHLTGARVSSLSPWQVAHTILLQSNLQRIDQRAQQQFPEPWPVFERLRRRLISPGISKAHARSDSQACCAVVLEFTDFRCKQGADMMKFGCKALPV